MIVTVQCSHYILNACNNTNCQWRTLQTIHISTRPCKNPEGVPAIHEGQALQECQGRLEGLNGALKEIIYFLIDEMAGLRVIEDPEAYSEAIEGVKSSVMEMRC